MHRSASTEAEIKRLITNHWNGRATRFDDLPNHGLHSEAQHQAWLILLRRLLGSQCTGGATSALSGAGQAGQLGMVAIVVRNRICDSV